MRFLNIRTIVGAFTLLGLYLTYGKVAGTNGLTWWGATWPLFTAYFIGILWYLFRMLPKL